MKELMFQRVDEKDIETLLDFIKELAAYEKMSDQVVATQSLLQMWMFEKKAAEAFFLTLGEEKIGFILYFYNFSTFMGRAGLYLEDLYIRPEHRGHGYGKAAMAFLAQTAVKNGCGRMEWSCLDWNQPSIDFYKALGAKPMDEWTVYRLSDENLIKYEN